MLWDELTEDQWHTRFNEEDAATLHRVFDNDTNNWSSSLADAVHDYNKRVGQGTSRSEAGVNGSTMHQDSSTNWEQERARQVDAFRQLPEEEQMRRSRVRRDAIQEALRVEDQL